MPRIVAEYLIVELFENAVNRYMADNYQKKPRAIRVGTIEMRALQEYCARYSTGSGQDRLCGRPPSFDGIPIVQGPELSGTEPMGANG